MKVGFQITFYTLEVNFIFEHVINKILNFFNDAEHCMCNLGAPTRYDQKIRAILSDWQTFLLTIVTIGRFIAQEIVFLVIRWFFIFHN